MKNTPVKVIVEVPYNRYNEQQIVYVSSMSKDNIPLKKETNKLLFRIINNETLLKTIADNLLTKEEYNELKDFIKLYNLNKENKEVTARNYKELQELKNSESIKNTYITVWLNDEHPIKKLFDKIVFYYIENYQEDEKLMKVIQQIDAEKYQSVDYYTYEGFLTENNNHEISLCIKENF